MAAASAHLGSGKINLSSLRDYYRRELLECLDKCNGTKVHLFYACLPICQLFLVIFKLISTILIGSQKKKKKKKKWELFSGFVPLALEILNVCTLMDYTCT